MSELMKVMEMHPFFQGFRNDHMQQLAGFAAEKEYGPGSIIVGEGENADHLYLIRNGKVAIELQLPNRDPITILTVEAGGVVGWSWIFPPHKWHFQARAVEPTRTIAVESKELMELCDTDPTLGYKVMRRASRLILDRLEAATQQLANSLFIVP